MASFPSFSYLVDDEVWLVMEYMDGGTLTDAIYEMYISEDEMAAVSREVRDPTCASEGLGRIVWETGAENWRDSMCQTLLLCGCYAMGKRGNCVAVCLHSLYSVLVLLSPAVAFSLCLLYL